MEKQPSIIFTVTNNLATDQRMQRICNSLHNSGFNVLLVGCSKHHNISIKSSYQTKLLNCTFKKGLLFYLEFNIRLFLFLLKTNSNIISAVDADTILACTIAAICKRTKLVFDAHEYFTEVPELVNKPVVKFIWKTIQQACINRVNAAYTVSPSLAHIFTKQFGLAFSTIYNMPVRQQNQILTEHKKPIILYQGDINPGRGIEETLTAIINLEVEFWIIGDGPLKEKINKLITEQNLEHKVKLFGKLLPTELANYTQQAFVGLNLLSPNGLSYQHSLANKFFDYVQAHIPVICADFVEYQNLNKQHQVALLCQNNSTQIYDTINALLHDKMLYQNLVSNCIVAAKEWHWQTQENLLIPIYKKLINE